MDCVLVDVGATYTRLGLADGDNVMLIEQVRTSDVVASGFYETLAGMIGKQSVNVDRKLVGVSMPGVLSNYGTFVPGTQPNFRLEPGSNPSQELVWHLGPEWKVVVENDGTAQAAAAARILFNGRSPTSTKMAYFGPGTGFGSGFVTTRGPTLFRHKTVFFDTQVVGSRTAEELLSARSLTPANYKMAAFDLVLLMLKIYRGELNKNIVQLTAREKMLLKGTKTFVLGGLFAKPEIMAAIVPKVKRMLISCRMISAEVVVVDEPNIGLLGSLELVREELA